MLVGWLLLHVRRECIWQWRDLYALADGGELSSSIDLEQANPSDKFHVSGDVLISVGVGGQTGFSRLP